MSARRLLGARPRLSWPQRIAVAALLVGGCQAGPPLASVTADREWLAVAALLSLLLLSRVSNRRRQEGVRRAAHVHAGLVTPVELARAVFEAARSGDFDAYRALYLTGGEAGRLMGTERASAYLERRARPVLDEAFGRLRAAIAPGAVYAGVELAGPDRYDLLVRGPEDQVARLPIGTFTRVGGLWKILEPPAP